MNVSEKWTYEPTCGGHDALLGRAVARGVVVVLHAEAVAHLMGYRGGDQSYQSIVILQQPVSITQSNTHIHRVISITRSNTAYTDMPNQNVFYFMLDTFNTVILLSLMVGEASFSSVVEHLFML